MPPELSEKTDEELALLVQGNNEQAFGVLMSRYQPKLLRYGRRFLEGGEQIEDVVQDVFIKTYQNIRSFDAARAFSPWIYRIAHNAFANAIRQKQRNPIIAIDFDAMIAHPSYERDPEGEEEVAEIKRLIDTGLASLSAKYREVLVLYYIENFSYQEIAEILRVPLGTVGIRMKRARESLKHYVDKT